VTVSLERNLFRSLTKEGQTREAILKAQIFGPLAYDAIIPVLLCEGYIVKLNDIIHLTPLGKTYLADDSPYNWQAGIGRFATDTVHLLEQIKAELNGEDRGQMTVPRNWNKNRPNRQTTETFLASMESKSAAPAFGLAQIDLNLRFGTKKLLDVGGGSGRFAATLCQQRKFQCTLLELPEVAKAAVSYLNGTGVEILEGDVLDSVPSGYDTHLLVDVIHMFDPKDAAKILCNCYDALPSGGTILLSNVLVSDSGFAPRTAVYFYLYMFRIGAGRTYKASEFKHLLEEAGFSDIGFEPYYGHNVLIYGVKH
jgi:acetylserotonin N-methyltransferase